MAQSYARSVVALLVILSLVGGNLALIDPVRAQTQPDVDTTILRIELHENTTATWELQIRTRLRTSDDKADYRAFQRQFENDTDAYLGPFSDRINGTVETASRATGREMNATGFEASTSLQSVPRQWGVVTYRFRWTNFAVERDGRLVVGDAFESGLFIAENDSLEVVAPAGYRVVSTTPSADKRDGDTLTWNGPESFADSEPRVVFEPEPTEEASVETTTAPSSRSGAGSFTGPAGAVFLVVLVAAAVWWKQSNETDTDDATRRLDDSDGGVERDHQNDGDESNTAEETTDSEASTVGTAPIVTDEDRVRTLLRKAGGRIRQKDVVTELDWSKSKVSRVLSRMEDDGTIEKLRLGRENVVELVEDADDDSTRGE